MALPSITLPTYELTIPSNGKKITIRPFLVKEEKLLLMALESQEDIDIINTTKQIIKNCIVDGDDVDIDKLPFFDVDYLFIALRAKSVGESIEVKFTCNNYHNGNVCGEVFPANIDIANCKIIKNEKLDPSIPVNAQFKVKMKYPNYTVMKSIMDNDNVLNKKIRIIAGSIDYIQDRDKVYTSKDVTKEELNAFVEGLTQEQYKRLEEWVDNFPYFVVTSQAKCPKCGYDHELEYREFTSFFV